jgi:hypothetical protein
LKARSSVCLVFFHCLLATVFFLVSPKQSLAADFTSSVVSILDGDTIEVLHNQHPTRIRLRGVNCPEKGQAFGKRAKQAASELAFGKEVTLLTHGLDKYGRTLAISRRSLPHSPLAGYSTRVLRPVTKWITTNTIPITNRIQEICIAIADTPMRFRAPAIKPTTRNTSA